MKPEDLIFDSLEKRFKTLMIGTLYRFEQSFGYLWNHGESPNTDNQIKFRQKWEDLRTDILNHGNNQIRLALNELDRFIDHQNKYSYNYQFVFNKNNNRR